METLHMSGSVYVCVCVCVSETEREREREREREGENRESWLERMSLLLGPRPFGFVLNFLSLSVGVSFCRQGAFQRFPSGWVPGTSSWLSHLWLCLAQRWTTTTCLFSAGEGRLGRDRASLLLAIEVHSLRLQAVCCSASGGDSLPCSGLAGAHSPAHLQVTSSISRSPKREVAIATSAHLFCTFVSLGLFKCFSPQLYDVIHYFHRR